ncbi:MAG: cysteine desulfurase family protein [Planctomycetaceae bacterium]|nr:cysteine desulfurase family protein [Planctomycetaceae bacterium]
MPIYLDHHSTTPVGERVLERMLPYFREKFGNAASINHVFGWRAAEAVERARQQVADLLNVEPQAIVFTSGATEANNLALKGVLRASPAGSHVVTTAIEHKAVLDPLKRLKRQGYGVTIVPVNAQGQVDPEQIAAAIKPETVLVSVMWANNEVGTIQPLHEINLLCKRRGVLLHTDAAQAVGKVPIDLTATNIDLLSLSGHKLYAPQGIGALVVRQGEPRIRLEPLFDGGGHEGRLRSGTLPVALIVGLGMACEIARDEMLSEADRLEHLARQLREGLSQRLTGLTFNGPPDIPFAGGLRTRLPGNVHVSFANIDGVALLANLKEIAVSSGSACTSADPEPSHVLRAMGVPEALSLASLRFGLGRETTAEQIDFTINYVAETVNRIRGQA